MKIALLERLRSLVLLSWLVVLSAAVPPTAYALGEVIKRFAFVPPSNTDRGKPINKAVVYWSCYLVGTSIALDCRFDFRIVGVRPGGCPDPNNPSEENACNSGGHIDGAHIGARPKGSVEFPPGNVDPNRTFVEGQTLSPSSERVKILYRVPQASGVYDIESRITLPSGFFCVETPNFPCNTLNSWFLKGEANVGVRLLRQLPGPGPDDRYVKGRRSPDPEHPDAVGYAGTPFTLLEIPFLAKDYFELSFDRFVLGVNDISLALGGVFDIQPANWKQPHKTHRAGVDVDINRPVINQETGERLRCEDNFALRLAVDQRLEPIERPNPFNLPRLNILSALLCEDEGFYHIDMRPLRFGR